MKNFRLLAEREIAGPEELPGAYRELLDLLPERALILLMGPVGAGKTTSIAAIAGMLKMKEIASPSFALHHRYENTEGRMIDHIDLYRLKDEEDLESSGFWDLFMQKKAWIFVEWGDRLNPEALPLNWWQARVHIQIPPENPTRRRLRLEIQNEP